MNPPPSSDRVDEAWRTEQTHLLAMATRMLHGFPFEAVGTIVGRSAAAVRQRASRALCRPSRRSRSRRA